MQTKSTNSPFMGQRLRAASMAALAVISLSLAAIAQSDAAQSEVARPGAAAVPVIPQQMRFTGTAVNRTGDTVEAVFSIYSAAEGGEPLFTETQQVAVDSEGHYAVLLGAATQGGLPQSLFAAGQARWLGVSIERSEEQPRTLLASVAYAMKAGDAETVGGLPATSFVTQQQFAASLGGQPQQAPTAPKSQFTPLLNPTVTGTGTTNYLPVWTSASNVGNSLIYQSGNNIGIGTTAPGGPLQLSTAYPAVTANSSNPISEFQVLTTGLPISSGVTDTGYRIGQKIVNYTTDPNFLGTLAAQYGLLASVGASTGAGSGTITNAYGVYINNLTGGSATITNNYGLYQATSTARNYFAGSVGIGTTTPTGDLEVSTAFPAVTTNGDNEIPEFLVSTEHLPISSGVTDTGYRVGAWIDNYTTDPQFLGTLSNQYGVLSRVGATTGSGSGTITNSYGVYIYNQTGGSATVTNPYGLYQASSAARNYFAGNVGIGTTSPAAKLEVNGTAKFDGIITWAAGQTFPGGTGITAITTTSPLTGGGTSGSVALGLNTSALETTLNGKYAQLGASNTFSQVNYFDGSADAYQTNGPGYGALLGWGSNGSIGTFGNSDTGPGVEAYSTSGQGVVGYVSTPTASSTASQNSPGVSGVLGYTGTSFSTDYAAESGIAYAGIWADTSASGTSGVPVALFATADDAFGIATFTNGADYPGLLVTNESGVGGEITGGVGDGLDGTAATTGNGVTGTTYAPTAGSAGAYGIALSRSLTGSVVNIYSGVWGDTSISLASVAPTWPIGVIGTADDSYAGVFLNNSDNESTLFVENYGTAGLGAAGSGTTVNGGGLFSTVMASSNEGTCGIGGGNLSCTGQIKSLVPSASGSRTVETYAMQSPENWMEDFGSGELQKGVAVVNIEPAFGDTITADASYHVFLTPNADSKGLYVINKTATTFEVRESGGGTATLSFDYRIVGKRRGFEAQRLKDVTERFTAETTNSRLIRNTSIRKPASRKPSPLAIAPGAHHRFVAPPKTPVRGVHPVANTAKLEK